MRNYKLLPLVESSFNMPSDYVPDSKNPRDPAYTGDWSDDNKYLKDNADDAIEKFVLSKENNDLDITNNVDTVLSTSPLRDSIVNSLVQKNKEKVDWFVEKSNYSIKNDMYIDKEMLDNTFDELNLLNSKEGMNLYYDIIKRAFLDLDEEYQLKYYEGY